MSSNAGWYAEVSVTIVEKDHYKANTNNAELHFSKKLIDMRTIGDVGKLLQDLEETIK